MMCGPDDIEQTVTVQVESRENTPMLGDAGDILQAAQKQCAAGVVAYDGFRSDSEYLSTRWKKQSPSWCRSSTR